MTWEEIISQLRAQVSRAMNQGQISLPCSAVANPGVVDLFYVEFSGVDGALKTTRTMLPKARPAPYHLPFVIKITDTKNRKLEYTVHCSDEVTNH